MPVTTYRQSPPFAVQIELTEGCNLRCDFCGLNGIRGKENDFKFLTLQNAIRITERLNEASWKPRIEFAMHGEPSANQRMPYIIKAFRKNLPSTTPLMMTSNGYGFLKDPTVIIDDLLESLNVLALDWYENVLLVPKILERYAGKHQPIYYPKNKEGNPHRRRTPEEHDLVIVQDIASATTGTHASLNNHAGCGSPKNSNAVGKRCAKPFREMSIRWDGNVAVCCNDWRSEYFCGNVLDQPLEEIWQGPAFAAARKKLYHGMRDFGPCEGCDALSYRPGLLPDQRGKQSLPVPNECDLQAIGKALGRGPLTLPVLREWEMVMVGMETKNPQT